jgi:YfiH family protein
MAPGRACAGFVFPDWPAPANVHAAVVRRDAPGASLPPFDRCNLGLRSGDDATTVQANRARIAQELGLPSAPRWLAQVHGAGVVRFDATRTDDEPQADAAVTSVPGTVLAILTADCLPVLLCDRDGGEVGAAHAGWRGLAGGVLESTVAALHAPPDRLLAWLGPAAGPHAYEVGDEVRDAFLAHAAVAATAFVPTRPGHWLVDLYALARQRLADAGVTAVHGGGLCTISDAAAYFSHRRDQRTGRMASLVWMD